MLYCDIKIIAQSHFTQNNQIKYIIAFKIFDENFHELRT